MKCSVSKHHQHPRKWLTRTCTVLSFCVDLDESIAKRRFYAFLVDRWIWRLDSQCRQSSFEAKIGILFSPFDEGFERSLLARCTGHQSHLSPERFWPPALETEREGVSRWHHVFATLTAVFGTDRSSVYMFSYFSMHVLCQCFCCHLADALWFVNQGCSAPWSNIPFVT